MGVAHILRATALVEPPRPPLSLEASESSFDLRCPSSATNPAPASSHRAFERARCNWFLLHLYSLGNYLKEIGPLAVILYLAFFFKD